MASAARVGTTPRPVRSKSGASSCALPHQGYAPLNPSIERTSPGKPGAASHLHVRPLRRIHEYKCVERFGQAVGVSAFAAQPGAVRCMNEKPRHTSANDFAAERVRSASSAWRQRVPGRYEPRFAEAATKNWGRRSAPEATVHLGSLKAVVGALGRKAGGTRLRTRPASVLPLRAPKVSRSQRRGDGPSFALRCTLWPNSAVERTNNGGSHLSACPRTAAVVCLSPLR